MMKVGQARKSKNKYAQHLIDNRKQGVVKNRLAFSRSVTQSSSEGRERGRGRGRMLKGRMDPLGARDVKAIGEGGEEGTGKVRRFPWSAVVVCQQAHPWFCV